MRPTDRCGSVPKQTVVAFGGSNLTEGPMGRRFRSGVGLRLVLGALVAIALCATPQLAAAQQPDLAAIQKRYGDLFAAGKYGEALQAAQQFEQAVKAQLGTQHVRYATALHFLGNVHRMR